jgi:hypothetical protein
MAMPALLYIKELLALLSRNAIGAKQLPTIKALRQVSGVLVHD